MAALISYFSKPCLQEQSPKQSCLTAPADRCLSSECLDHRESVESSIDRVACSQQSSNNRVSSNGKGCAGEKGSLGLLLFNVNNNDCKEGGKYQADIVALHGLNGHREETWTYNDQRSGHTCLWVRDCLPADLPGSRVFSYGYRPKVLWNDSVSHIDEFAIELLADLNVNRRHCVVSRSLYSVYALRLNRTTFY